MVSYKSAVFRFAATYNAMYYICIALWWETCKSNVIPLYDDVNRSIKNMACKSSGQLHMAIYKKTYGFDDPFVYWIRHFYVVLTQ